MSDLELRRRESLTRAEAAKRLSAFAESLAGDGKIEVDLSLRVADDVRAEFEVEVNGDEIELELELKWSTAPAGPGRSTSEAKTGTQERATAAQEESGGRRGGT